MCQKWFVDHKKSFTDIRNRDRETVCWLYERAEFKGVFDYTQRENNENAPHSSVVVY